MPEQEGGAYVDYQFQFHKGTIKPFIPYANTTTSPGFNSIKVRLNPHVHDLHVDVKSVSIP